MDISQYKQNPQTFKATVEKAGSKVYIVLPFDPDNVWGTKERHYVHGTVDEIRLRATLQELDENSIVSLGAAFRRDTGIEPGVVVEVFVEPEGPQLYNMAEDIVTALTAESEAVQFFNGLATHYRKNYVNWVEDAKRPETRAKRVEEMVSLLKQGKQKK